MPGYSGPFGTERQPVAINAEPRGRRVLGSEHPDTLNPKQNLANAYWYQGKYPQAEALFSEFSEIRRRVLAILFAVVVKRIYENMLIET